MDLVQKQLVGPRFRQIRAGRFDREKLLNAKHCKKKKNHSVNRDRSKVDSAKDRRRVAAEVKNSQEREFHRQRVRAYWAGELECYPK